MSVKIILSYVKLSPILITYFGIIILLQISSIFVAFSIYINTENVII